MLNELNENRRFLASLVYSKKRSFTAERIISEYKKKNGHVVIDGRESIRGFLRGLVELGTLRDEGNRYRVIA